MGYAILRIAKCTQAGALRMVRHALRDDTVPNAIPGIKPDIVAGSRTSKPAHERLRGAIAAAKAVPKGWRKDAVAAVDCLVTMTREDAKRLSREDQDRYFDKALAMLAKRFGGLANCLTAAIHRDETTPHLQAIFMPLDESGGFVANKMIGGPAGLRRMQDQIGEIGKPFRLERGIQGSRAHHVPVRSLYAVANASQIDLVPVPPAPGMIDRLKPDYKAKKAAHLAALDHNAKARRQIQAQAEKGRALHPAQLARAASQYRANLKAADAAKVRIEAANIVRAEAETTLKRIEKVTNTASTWAYLEAFAEASKRADPRYVAKLSAQLGIQLRPGLNLIDQVRKAKASSLTGPGASMAAAAKLDEAAQSARVQPIGEALMLRQDPDGPGQELSPQPSPR